MSRRAPTSPSIHADRHTDAEAAHPHAPRFRAIAAIAFIVAAGVWAYHNSFTGAFIFDDRTDILDNARITQPLLSGAALRHTSRPLVDLTLAINNALGGFDPRGYHALNLLIHLATALLLFDLIRRALSRRGVRIEDAETVALASTLIWTVHPLLTQAVTYVIQRAESLMALWCVAMLDCLDRAERTGQRRWRVLTVAACALGMATKPVMVTAPFVAWLYDRTFLSNSFRAAWRRHRSIYLGLASTWLLLVAVLVAAPQDYASTAGWKVTTVSPWHYALTQPGVIVHYLRLAAWPSDLTFDYAWPIVSSIVAAMPLLLVVGSLLAATVWALRRSPGVGFVSAACWLVLAPTSSVLPVVDPIFEHRMYLPLAGLVVLAVLVGRLALYAISPPVARRTVGAVVVVACVAVLGRGTIARNHDYRSEASLWADTAAKRPDNPRAHDNLGAALARHGDFERAMLEFMDAIRLSPTYADAHYNLGLAFARRGRPTEAVASFNRALDLNPEDPQAHSGLAILLADQGRLADAETHLRQALRLRPESIDAHYNVATVLAQQHHLDEAAAMYRELLALQPRHARAHNNYGVVLARLGHTSEAAKEMLEAVRLDPTDREARGNIQAINAALQDAAIRNAHRDGE